MTTAQQETLQAPFPSATMAYVRAWLSERLDVRYTPKMMCVSNESNERQTWADILDRLLERGDVTRVEFHAQAGGSTHAHLTGPFGSVQESGDSIKTALSRALTIAICKLPGESKPLFLEEAAP